MRYAIALAVLMLASASAGAQRLGRRCSLVYAAPAGATINRLPDNTRQIFVGGGFTGRCAGTSIVVTSDSAEYYEAQELVNLIGRATYTEDSTRVTSDVMRYNATSEYLEATGNVRMRSGNSTLTASHVIYFRQAPGMRDETEAYATGRPRLTLRDTTTGADTTPTIIDADRLRMEADSLYYAGGNVVITRPDMIARADSIATNRNRETARLVGGPPRVTGEGENRFLLQGRILDVYGRARQLSRVLAQGEAEAESDSLRLTADTIDMRMTSGRIDSVATWGSGRSRAVAPGQDITAGRISISMPGQRLRSLFATGRARVETRPDTSFASQERDWIAGDSVRATFMTSRGATDSATRTVLDTLIAWGQAQSFYQVPPTDARDSLPALSYVAGGRIVIAFSGGEIASVRVDEEVRGIMLEPVRRDTTSAVRRSPSGQRQ